MPTGQCSQFTSMAFTSILKGQDIQISMDGRGAWHENAFVERLWRSVNYEEEDYLGAYETVSAAKASVDRYIQFYNSRQPLSSLDRQIPDQFYFESLTLSMACVPSKHELPIGLIH